MFSSFWRHPRLHLHSGRLADAFIQRLKIRTFVRRKRNNNPCRYSEDVHRTECQALTIARLTHSSYTTKIARIRCYNATMLRTAFNCQDVQHTISVYIKCWDVQTYTKCERGGWGRGSKGEAMQSPGAL